MATTPTNKPIPSEDPRDLKFNAGKIDEEVNGSADYYADRFGAQRLTNTGRNHQFQGQMTQQADDWLKQLNQQSSDFQKFLLNSGYQFLGDYENGPFQFSARNQYIRYDNQYYRLNSATGVGFTTTGTDATSFANDVTHFVLMDGDTLRQNLSAEDGTSLVATLGNKPLVAVSYFKNKGMSDQDAVQAAFSSGYPVLMDADVTLTSPIDTDRSAPLEVTYKPGVVVTNKDYLPRLVTHPAHKVSGNAVKVKAVPELTSAGGAVSHQAMSVEMAVHDTLSSGPTYEPYVAFMAGIESFNCERQKLWAMNLLTNAHNLNVGDEVYGVEIDCNIDGAVGNGQYVGCYIAGVGDLSTSAGADGIRVQRMRDGVAKWNVGVRIYDAVTGINITDAKTYSIFASGEAPIARRKTTQNGAWTYFHSVSTSAIPWGVDDYGDTYSRRLYLGSGNGKSKNRVNLDGGVSFHTTTAAVSWGAIAANGYVDKDVTSLIGVSIADWTNYTIDVTPFGYAGAMPVVAVQAYINSAKTQAFVRVINISGAELSSCNVGLNVKVCGHSVTN